MTPADFQAGMAELSDVFGAKWPKALADRIWNMVKDIDGQAFKSITRGMAFGSLKPPTAGEIVSACGSLIRTAKEKRKQAAIEQMNREGRCRQCDNYGWVFTEIAGKAPEYGFRCNACRAAQVHQISGAIPYWNPEKYPKMQIRDYNPPPAGSATRASVTSAMGAILSDWGGDAAP